MPPSSQEEKAAAAVAQALLGSLAQLPPDLPPPVQLPPPADQQAQPGAQAPPDQADEIKDDPPPPAPEQKDQSTDLSTPRHRLLQRLLRALPIASPAQLTAMINVFDPNRDVVPQAPPTKILEPRLPVPNPTQEGCHAPPNQPRTHFSIYYPSRHSKGRGSGN